MQADHGSSWQGIVYLWGLDASGKPVQEYLPDDETGDCRGLLNLAKAMISTAGCPPMWVVTRGAQRTQRESKLGAIDQAMLWGLGRVFASEHSALLGGLIDLDPHTVHEDDAANLLDELRDRPHVDHRPLRLRLRDDPEQRDDDDQNEMLVQSHDKSPS